jgi:hypothetical protein
MRLERILQTLTAKYKDNIHQSHITFLNLVIDAMGLGASLTCTSLGRALDTKTTMKHNIKRVDYMLGSECLHQERVQYYTAIAASLIGKNVRALINIDWSSTTPCRKFHILRASLVVENKGRALTLYEENHPESDLTTEKVHKKFLAKLKEILPNDCHPIILTDAGFKVNWFKLIIKHGWDYVGRVRGNTYYRLAPASNIWKNCHDLYKKATVNPVYLGELELSKTHQWKCHSHLIKQKLKGRKKKGVMGKIDASTASRKNAKRASDPWLLVTSISSKKLSKKIIAFYSTRMQIEETFRDTKSPQYGMGLKLSRTKSAKRFDILLLIGSLMHYILYVLGRVAEKENMAKDFQSNSIKNRRVLSPVFLARQLWRSGGITDLVSKVPNAIKQIKLEAGYVYSSL